MIGPATHFQHLFKRTILKCQISGTWCALTHSSFISWSLTSLWASTMTVLIHLVIVGLAISVVLPTLMETNNLFLFPTCPASQSYSGYNIWVKISLNIFSSGSLPTNPDSAVGWLRLVGFPPQWNDHELFMNGSWTVHVQFMNTCSWTVHELFMNMKWPSSWSWWGSWTWSS